MGEKKRKKLEKYMESEMGKVRQEGEQISEEIDKLNLSLAANIKATEDLAKLDVSAKETKETTAPPPVVSDATNRMVEFLAKSIKEKESDLECPVCMETAGADLHVPGDAPHLLGVQTQGEGVPRVPGAVPGPAQEAPLRREDCRGVEKAQR